LALVGRLHIELRVSRRFVSDLAGQLKLQDIKRSGNILACPFACIHSSSRWGPGPAAQEYFVLGFINEGSCSSYSRHLATLKRPSALSGPIFGQPWLA